MLVKKMPAVLKDDKFSRRYLVSEPPNVFDGAELIVTERETTQPNHTDVVYWATGLGQIYLEGALTRALDVSHSQHAAQRLQSHSS